MFSKAGAPCQVYREGLISSELSLVPMRAQVINHWHLGLKYFVTGSWCTLEICNGKCSGRIFSWTCALWHPAASDYFDYLACFHCIWGFIFVMRNTQHYWWCRQEVWHSYALVCICAFDIIWYFVEVWHVGMQLVYRIIRIQDSSVSIKCIARILLTVQILAFLQQSCPAQ